ncbi:MAG: hypothetical protein Q4F72_05185 [Desulfovibrionaceae bacterium]|nr:hypothetical protein [Desulfovibrionaceae bacterium]
MRKQATTYLLFLFLLCLVLPQTACRKTAGMSPAESLHPTLPGDLVISRSVTLETADRAHGETANVIISDHRAIAGRLQQRVEQQMRDHGFDLSSQPSKADRLITLIVLHRGTGGREEMEGCVRSGYGAPVASLQGQGAVLLADLLVVRRRVPKKNAYLNNVSAHNTLSSNQVRIGLYSSDVRELRDRGLEEALSREIAVIAAFGEDSQVHSPSSLAPAKPSAGKARKSVRKSKKARKSQAKSSSRKTKKAKTQSGRKTRNSSR